MADGLVLVTGATGAVGPEVVRAFVAAGHRVRALSIDAPSTGLLPPGVEARVGDICDGSAVRSATAGARVVVHLAAFLHQFKNVAGLDRQFQRINVGGTENVVRAAVSEGVGRVVFLSTIAVYGSARGESIDETVPPIPDSDYGRSKLAAEEVVLSAAGAGGEPIGVVLRSAAVYGARVKGNYRRLAEAIARRRFVQLGRCLNRRTLVYDQDLARAIVLAAEHRDAAGRVFNVTDGSVHTLAAVIAAIHRATGRRPPRLHVPIAPVRGLVSVSESLFRSVRLQSPITRALLEKYAEDVAVDGTLIEAVLGFKPQVDLEAGWRETLASW